MADTQNPVMVAQRSEAGLWMGILALAGILCVSIVAVVFVFLAQQKGAVAPVAPPPAQPLVINNVIPMGQQAPVAENKEAPGATRAPADSKFTQAVPGKFKEPGKGQRQIAVKRADPAPPPYENPTAMTGFAIRRGNPVQHAARGPLPNRIPMGQRESMAIGSDAGPAGSGPSYALPGSAPSGTSFSNSPDIVLTAETVSAGALEVTVNSLRRSSKPLDPHGYQPLAGNEFLIADLSIYNSSSEDVMLDASSIWASDANDPDMGYIQNVELLGDRFPKKVRAGESLDLVAAIVFYTSEPPVSLVVQPPEGDAVRLPIRQ